MQGTKCNNLSDGNSVMNIVRLAMPICVAMLFQMGFNIVDMIFVGMISPEAIAAVSMVFPVVFFFVSLAMGLGIGVTAYISRTLGSGDIDKAGKIASNGIVFGVVVAVVFGLSGFVFCEQVFSLMGAGSEILDIVVSYSKIIFISFVFLFVGFFASSILHGEGDMKTPMKFMIIATLMNVVLDPILIFGFGSVPAMGIEGAAVATLVSRFVVVFLMMRHFYLERSVVCPVFRNFRFDCSIMKEIFRVGLPASFTNISISLGMILYLKLVSFSGSYGIAAFGVGGRVESIVLIPAIAVSGAVLTIIGHCCGAGKFRQARKVLMDGIMMTVVSMAILGVLSLFLSNRILLLFTDNPEVIRIGAEYLIYRIPVFAFLGVIFVVSSAFQGIGNSKIGLFIILLEFFAVGVPVAYVLNGVMGLTGIWIGCSLGNIVAGVFAFLFGFYGFREDRIKDYRVTC